MPVYNDADALDDCLKSIAAQSSMPEEVIVVDNNSTDRTMAVARQYPFVTILSEKKQGVVHARNRGFSAARGDVIGRLDADTCIEKDWVATIRRLFADGETSAVSGSMTYRAVTWATVLGYADSSIRHYLALALGGELALQGANMAVRRSAWKNVQHTVCAFQGIHEDFDLSVHLSQAGYTNTFQPSLRASVVLRQATGSWGQFARYIITCPATYIKHRRLAGIHILAVALVVIAAYPVLHVLHAGYDSSTGRFSLEKLLGEKPATRVNPAIFVE